MNDSAGNEVLSGQQAIETINRLPDSMKLPVLLIACCHLRVGEALAMSREDVTDSESGMTLRVNWRVVEDSSGTAFVPAQRPGTEIHVPQSLIAQLREHLARCGPEPDTLLFVKPNGEPWSTPEFSRSFRAALSAAGLPSVSLHGFRSVAMS